MHTKHYVLLISCMASTACSNEQPANHNAATYIIDTHKGQMADYGASPWYSTDLEVCNPNNTDDCQSIILKPRALLKSEQNENSKNAHIAFDSGANFSWITSDECKSQACDAHHSVDLAKTNIRNNGEIESKSFGPWGTMEVKTAAAKFAFDKSVIGDDFPFYASTSYKGLQFETLAWGGGIGLPSNNRIDESNKGSQNFIQTLMESKIISKPTFTVAFAGDDTGQILFGSPADNPSAADSSITDQLILPPYASCETDVLDYLWWSHLQRASFGDTDLPALKNIGFALDTGSSHFKGDSQYLFPILDRLQSYSYQDKPIFEPVHENGLLVGLMYREDLDEDDRSAIWSGILPDFKLHLQGDCSANGEQSNTGILSVPPRQYSYLVETGERSGRWVVAFHVLDGIGGLLVGSTLMESFSTRFEHQQAEDQLSQGNMTLRPNSHGQTTLSCGPSLPKMAVDLSGRWYNQYCSQIQITTEDSGALSGSYLSTTGGSGAFNLTGFQGTNNSSTCGVPVSIGIQWHPSNQGAETNESKYWVSSYSGLFLPEQIITIDGQSQRTINASFELLNELIPTTSQQTLPVYGQKGLAMLPESLFFTRQAPDYCLPSNAPEPVAGCLAAPLNNVALGSWTSDLGTLTIESADCNGLQGIFNRADGDTFLVTGLIDPNKVRTFNGETVLQSLTLALRNDDGEVMSLVGAVSKDQRNLITWDTQITSTSYEDRYTANSVSVTQWNKL